MLKKEEENPSGLQISVNTLKGGLVIAASFTFSGFVAVFPFLTGRIPTANAAEHEDIVAAAALINTTMNMAVTFAVTGLYAIGIYVSKELGELTSKPEEEQQRKELISRIIRNATLLGLPTIIFTAPPLFFSETLFKAFGQDPTVAKYAQNYLRTYALSTFPVIFRTIFEQVMFSFDSKTAAMGLSILAFGIGVGTSIMLSFGLGPFPQLGLEGIAIGFVAHDYLVPTMLGAYIAFNNKFKDYNFFKIFDFKKEDKKQIVELIRIGLPLAATIASQVGSVFVCNTLAGIYSENALTAQAFPSTLAFITLLPYLGIGITSSMDFSKALGEAKYDLARRIAIYGPLTAVLTVLPLCIATAVYPEMLEFLIANSAFNEEVIALARKLIIYFATGIPLEAAAYSMLQILRGTGDNLVPSLIAIGSDWLGIGIGYATAFHSNLGVQGIGVGYLAGSVVRILGMGLRWYGETQSEKLENNAQEKQQKDEEKAPLMSGHEEINIQQSLKSDAAPVNNKSSWGSCFTSWCNWFSCADNDKQESDTKNKLSSASIFAQLKPSTLM